MPYKSESEQFTEILATNRLFTSSVLYNKSNRRRRKYNTVLMHETISGRQKFLIKITSSEI